jgi:acylphosphatase
VAGHFEGPDDAVDALVAWCRRGPSYAAVRNVAVTEARPTGAEDFTVRY